MNPTKAEKHLAAQNKPKTCEKDKRHFVEHDYHDHANDKEEDYRSLEGSASTAHKAGGKAIAVDSEYGEEYRALRARGGVTIPFPLKLHHMLDTIDNDGYGDVASWQPHGRAFLVHKPSEFVSTVMPKYFKQTKLTSFQRQLNLYGFRRLTKGPDTGAYYHELFLRGRPFLCHKMTRTKIKGTGFKAASSPETEPDFYHMPYVQPKQENLRGEVCPPGMPSPSPTPVGSSSLSLCGFSAFHSSHSFQDLAPSCAAETPSLKSCRPLMPPAKLTSCSEIIPITPDCGTKPGYQDSFPNMDPITDPKFPELPLLCSSSHVIATSGIDCQSVSSAESVNAGNNLPDLDEDIVFFEGKQFHYLDTAEVVPFQLSRRPESMSSTQCFVPNEHSQHYPTETSPNETCYYPRYTNLSSAMPNSAIQRWN